MSLDDQQDLRQSVLLNLGLQPEQTVVAVAGGAELPLPVPDGTADWVTFFDVFTQVLDEQIYRFLAEAKRVLKPDGRIVFSFLDYDVPQHWALFAEAVLTADGRRKPWEGFRYPIQGETEPESALGTTRSTGWELLRFLNRPTIEAWALHLGLSLEYHYSGEVKWLQPLRENDDGDAKAFGQSVAVLAILPT